MNCFDGLVIDAHCDTILKIYNEKGNLYNNIFHLDIHRIKSHYKSYIQVFAIFIEPEYNGSEAFILANKMIDTFYNEISRFNEDIKICLDANDILYIEKNGGIGAILALEGGTCLNGKLDNLVHFYKRGVRILSLTWNNKNDLACGIMDAVAGNLPEKDRGLSSFGIEVIKKINDLGIVLDVSHISDEAFYQICDITNEPFIVSHSNSRAKCSNFRNLTDDQLLQIKNAGGVVGINMNPPFLNDKGKADINDIIFHIEHIASVTGENHLGLGTDFDGIDSTPVNIKGVESLYNIFNRLLQLNYSESFVRKFAGLNYKRVFSKIF